MDAIKVDRERGEKAESSGGASKAFSYGGRAGYFFPRYPSAMDKVSSHFARSPFAHPRSRLLFVSSALPFTPSIHLPTLRTRSQSRPGALSPSVSRLFSFFFEFPSVFSALHGETSFVCRNELHVSTDSLIAGGLDDRVNRRQRVSSLSSPPYIENPNIKKSDL